VSALPGCPAVCCCDRACCRIEGGRGGAVLVTCG
jgi:hypothetical protein